MKQEQWVIILHYPFGTGTAVLPFRLELEAEAHLLCQQLQHWCRYRLTYRRRRPREWCVYRLGMDASRRCIGEFETQDEAELFSIVERRSHYNALLFEGKDKPRYLFVVERRLAEVT